MAPHPGQLGAPSREKGTCQERAYGALALLVVLMREHVC
jgi:hypothetical protein